MQNAHDFFKMRKDEISNNFYVPRGSFGLQLFPWFPCSPSTHLPVTERLQCCILSSWCMPYLPGIGPAFYRFLYVLLLSPHFLSLGHTQPHNCSLSPTAPLTCTLLCFALLLRFVPLGRMENLQHPALCPVLDSLPQSQGTSQVNSFFKYLICST